MSNSLDPDQDRHFVGPDLDPNCLQRLSADDKSRHQQGKHVLGIIEHLTHVATYYGKKLINSFEFKIFDYLDL